MKKATASQTIGVQMITAADGSAFTGSVTCNYTIDGGTQTAGTTVTSEGNGFHTMPVDATISDGDHIGFTFTGTGAIPATVQVYTGFPQTVDNDVLAAGASGFAAIDTVVDTILVDTADMQPRVAAIEVDTGTTLDGKIDTIGTDTTATQTLAAGATGFAAIDTVVDTILVDTADMQPRVTAIEVDTGTTLDGKINTIDGIVDTILVDTADMQPRVAAIEVDTGTTLDGKIDTIDTVVDAVKVVTDKFVFTKANEVDANTKSINDAEVIGDGNATPWDGA